MTWQSNLKLEEESRSRFDDVPLQSTIWRLDAFEKVDDI